MEVEVKSMCCHVWVHCIKLPGELQLYFRNIYILVLFVEGTGKLCIWGSEMYKVETCIWEEYFLVSPVPMKASILTSKKKSSFT